MRGVTAVFNKEFKSFFYSPVAYVIIALFTLITGISFYNLLSDFINASLMDQMYAQQYQQAPRILNMNFQVIVPTFFNVVLISLFTLPLVTMRLYSEEKRSGTVELLYTTPITPVQIIAGKFLAGLAFYGVLLLPTVFFQSILFSYGDPAFWPVVSAYIGLLLMGSAYISLGLFISTTTENQIIAAIGGFGLSLLLWFIGWSASSAGATLGGILNYLSIINHFSDFAQGVIDTTHVAYYILFSAFGLYLSLKVIESVKWRA
jgi:ABC-2 type transport system permease protein